MTIRERLGRLFEIPAQKPKTFPGKTLGKRTTYLNEKRDTKIVEYRNIYEQGGPVSEGVDCYPLMMLSNGYRVEGDRMDEAQIFLDEIDFETTAWKTIVDALVVKIGLAEIQAGLASDKYPIAKVDHRYPETFEEIRDDYGKLLGYKQRIGQDFGVKKEIDVRVEDMFRLDLGLPLIERAYDDIMRDAKISTGTAKAIERHGFPRYHIGVGVSGETIAQAEIDAIAKQFEDLKPQHEMATPADVKIENIDSGGVPNAKTYGEWSMERLCSALGVPEEMMGLGRGVLTGEIRMLGFWDKIGTLQKRFARQWNSQIMDRWSGKPGAVKVVFNDVSPVDETKIAELIGKLTAASGALDPFQIITPEWCRKRLGISEEDFQKWADEQQAKEPKVQVIPNGMIPDAKEEKKEPKEVK